MSGKLICNDGTVVQISKETEIELRAAFRPKPTPELKFGDIVRCFSGLRVLLYDVHGVLRAHARYGNGNPRVDLSPLNTYALTGQNIFKDNMLDLQG